MIEINRITSEEQESLIQKKLDTRTNIALLCSDDNENCDVNRNVNIELCRDDWKYFVDNFVWLEDPEVSDTTKKEKPFLLYDYQEKAGDEIVKAITSGYDLPIEKSRKMGATWLVLAILLYGWHFKQWDALIGSRKAEEVDLRGDMGTLFEKLRFMARRLPHWMFPTLKPMKHDNRMRLIHPDHGAVLVGEGNNSDFGRSDRKKVIFLDEFTSWETTDRAVWQGTASTSACRIPVSTPNRRGTNCQYYKVIEEARKKNLPLLRLHWTLHPVFSKNLSFNELGEPRSPWYNREVERSTDPEEVAQELDINYEASMGGRVFPGYSHEEQCRDDVWYNPNLPLYVAWDFGLDTTAMLWIQTDGEKIYIIDEYANLDTSIYHYIEILESKDYKKAIHFGDPNSGNARHITSMQSPITILRKHGIVFRVDSPSIKGRIRAARNILKDVVVSSSCILTDNMFTSWQMVKPKTGNVSSETPRHDEHSHIGEAFTYFAYSYRRKNKIREPTAKEYKSISGVTL